MAVHSMRDSEHPASLHDRFIAKLAHELRQPIGIILTALKVMRERSGGTDHRACDVIERQAVLLRRLVDDLLDVTRVEEGKIDLRTERLDLRAVVRDVADAMRAVFQARQQHFALLLPTGPVWVDGDRMRLEQILTNLLANAAKYTGDAGEIAVTLEGSPCTATVRVIDNGRGIAPDSLPHIFDLFVQESTDHPIGLGIGLNVVRGLVELHGGSVAANSRGTGRGSEFVVTLPAVQ